LLFTAYGTARVEREREREREERERLKRNAREERIS